MADPQEPGKVAGYRPQSEEHIYLANRVKALENELGALVAELGERDDIDKRALALGRTNLQTGFMWTVRSIFQPESKL